MHYVDLQMKLAECNVYFMFLAKNASYFVVLHHMIIISSDHSIKTTIHTGCETLIQNKQANNTCAHIKFVFLEIN